MSGIPLPVVVSVTGFLALLILGSYAFTWQTYRTRSNRDGTMFKRIDEIREENVTENEAMKERFHAYQLQVAKEYVSVEHLREVEQRLTTSIDTLTAAVKDLTRSFDRMEGSKGK